ncbi:thioredoxin [Pholiota molesta]|nr:thioredoxin [Pholiota molesta]
MVVKAIESFDQYKSIDHLPVFEKLSEQIEGVDYYKVDVDEHDSIAQVAGVKAMPTFMLFKDSNKVDSVVGANPPAVQNLVKQGAALA